MERGSKGSQVSGTAHLICPPAFSRGTAVAMVPVETKRSGEVESGPQRHTSCPTPLVARRLQPVRNEAAINTILYNAWPTSHPATWPGPPYLAWPTLQPGLAHPATRPGPPCYLAWLMHLTQWMGVLLMAPLPILKSLLARSVFIGGGEAGEGVM